MKNQKKLFEDLPTTLSSQVRGGWWGYQTAYPCSSYNSSPSYNYGYGQMPNVRQTTNVNVYYDD